MRPLCLIFTVVDHKYVLLGQGMPEFVFANRSGLEMFETTSSSLQDLEWEKTLNENDCKLSYATFTQVLQQVCVSPLLCVTSLYCTNFSNLFYSAVTQFYTLINRVN